METGLIAPNEANGLKRHSHLKECYATTKSDVWAEGSSTTGNIGKLGLFNQEDIRKPTKIFVAQCGFFTKYSFLLLPLRDAQFSQTGLCVGRVSTKLLRSVG